MLKDILEDFLTDIVAEGFWEQMKQVPRWLWFTICGLAFGAAGYFWFAMDGSYWTWIALALGVIMFIAGLANG